MKIRAVLDVLGGVVVRGIGGKRDEYRPIVSQLTQSTEPRDIACAIAESTGIHDFYLADLDAIQKRSKPEHRLASWFHARGWSLWIDGGIVCAAELAAWANGGARPVIGTETFADPPSDLKVDSTEMPVLSLDTVQGGLLGAGKRRYADAASLWKAWRTTGIVDLILMDLARVGSYQGPIETCGENRDAASSLFQGARLHAAGGVRHRQDLQALEAAGYHSALVASAIHDGRLFSSKDSARLQG